MERYQPLNENKNIIAYHGSNTKFNKFSLNTKHNYNDKASIIGIFFTDTITEAKFFGKNIAKCSLNLGKNKKVSDNEIEDFINKWLNDLKYNDIDEYDFQMETRQYANSKNINKGLELAIIDAKQDKYDSVTYFDSIDNVTWYIMFTIKNITILNWL